MFFLFINILDLEDFCWRHTEIFFYNPQHNNEGYFHQRIVYLNKKVSRLGMPACSLIEYSTLSLIT